MFERNIFCAVRKREREREIQHHTIVYDCLSLLKKMFNIFRGDTKTMYISLNDRFDKTLRISSTGLMAIVEVMIYVGKIYPYYSG